MTSRDLEKNVHSKLVGAMRLIDFGLYEQILPKRRYEIYECMNSISIRWYFFGYHPLGTLCEL